MTSSAAFNDNVSPFPGESRARLRASDANRAATVQTLQEAVGHGLLTYEEGSDRMAAARPPTGGGSRPWAGASGPRSRAGPPGPRAGLGGAPAATPPPG